jgi:hypothetical protein
MIGQGLTSVRPCSFWIKEDLTTGGTHQVIAPPSGTPMMKCAWLGMIAYPKK